MFVTGQTLKLALAAGVAAASLAGCNTVAGMGRDLQAVGNVITGTADKANPSRQRYHDDGSLAGGPPRQKPKPASGRSPY